MTKYLMKFRLSNLFILSLAATCQFTFAEPSEKPADQQAAKSQATGQTPTMNLGNIRVVKVEGSSVQLVDAAGQS